MFFVTYVPDHYKVDHKDLTLSHKGSTTTVFRLFLMSQIIHVNKGMVNEHRKLTTLNTRSSFKIKILICKRESPKKNSKGNSNCQAQCLSVKFHTGTSDLDQSCRERCQYCYRLITRQNMTDKDKTLIFSGVNDANKHLSTCEYNCQFSHSEYSLCFIQEKNYSDTSFCNAYVLSKTHHFTKCEHCTCRIKSFNSQSVCPRRKSNISSSS